MSKSCGRFTSDKKVCEYFRRRNTVAFTPYMGSFRHVRRFVGSRFSSSILTGRPSETSVRRLGCSALPLDPRARTFREETGNFDLLCPRTRRKVRGHFFREFSGLESDLERCGAGPEALSRFVFFRAPKVPRSSRPTASESLSRTATKIVIGKNPEFGVFAFPRRAWHHGRACFKPGWFLRSGTQVQKSALFHRGFPVRFDDARNPPQRAPRATPSGFFARHARDPLILDAAALLRLAQNRMGQFAAAFFILFPLIPAAVADGRAARRRAEMRGMPPNPPMLARAERFLALIVALVHGATLVPAVFTDPFFWLFPVPTLFGALALRTIVRHRSTGR